MAVLKQSQWPKSSSLLCHKHVVVKAKNYSYLFDPTSESQLVELSLLSEALTRVLEEECCFGEEQTDLFLRGKWRSFKQTQVSCSKERSCYPSSQVTYKVSTPRKGSPVALELKNLLNQHDHFCSVCVSTAAIVQNTCGVFILQGRVNKLALKRKCLHLFKRNILYCKVYRKFHV